MGENFPITRLREQFHSYGIHSFYRICPKTFCIKSYTPWNMIKIGRLTRGILLIESADDGRPYYNLTLPGELTKDRPDNLYFGLLGSMNTND